MTTDSAIYKRTVGKVERASRYLELHEFTQIGDPYDRLCQSANLCGTSGRIAIAAAGYLVGTPAFRGSRAFDNCFENGDGGQVVTALVAMAARNPGLHAAIVADFGGTFPAGWIETATQINGELLL